MEHVRTVRFDPSSAGRRRRLEVRLLPRPFPNTSWYDEMESIRSRPG
jgi:hypothetical protein